MNLTQFFPGAGLPPGASVQMPAIANAGTNQFVTAANELYVNTATPSVVPQSSCNALLPAALGATNDVTMPTTQTSLLGFQMAANVISSGYYSGIISNAAQQSTHGFYVGATYYLFSPSDANNTIGWISSTDTQNYTPFVQITPLAGLMIVDVFYNAANATWYFLEVNGTIFSTTNITTFANATFYSLPMLTNANAYVRLTQINSVWYAVGASTTGNGYRVSTSTNLLAWTVAIENTAGAGAAVNIIQGAGTGANTEIMVMCAAGDTTLHSVNNGASFTAVTATTGLTTAYIKNIFYSSRTGLYYIATNSANYVYVSVSSTGTLTSATWSNNNTSAQTTTIGNTSWPVSIVDTGTNVGVVFTNIGYVTNFYYGAGFESVVGPLLPQETITDTGYGYAQGAKAMWLNNALFVAYAESPGQFQQQKTNQLLAVCTGPTCSGIALSLAFPMSNLNVFNVGQTPTISQFNSWSGLAYLSGSYYAAGGIEYYSSALYGYVAYLFKINSSLTTFSCPVTPVLVYTGQVYPSFQSASLSNPQLNATGTGLNWIAYQNNNISTNAAITNTPMFSFNGTTFTGVLLQPAVSVGAGGMVNGNSCITNQPSSCTSIPKWSSALNAYVTAMPAHNSGGATNLAVVGTIPAITGSSNVSPSTLLSYACGNTTTVSQVTSLDVLSGGGIVAVFQYGNYQFYLNVNLGSGNELLLAGTNYGPCTYAMWEVVYNGTSYLVFGWFNQTNNLLNIYKLSATDGPNLVLSNYIVPNINFNTISTITNNLKRVFSYNGSFYLGDVVANSTTARNSLMLTPHNGSFTVTPAYLYVGGDSANAGQANTYTTMNTITTVNTSGVPSVFIPAGAAGSFVKMR